MDLICYPLLGTRSRRALLRHKGRWGHRYQYSPKAALLHNLAEKLGWNIESVQQQLLQERAYLLKRTLS
jgi:hypothetical protein